METMQLNFNAPIKENAMMGGEFLIKGIAINATTTDNNHTFLSEELEKAAGTMKGIPLLIDHNNTVESIKGRVKEGFFDSQNNRVDFEAAVMDKGMQEKIQKGLINSVSIGATVKDIEEGENGDIIPRGIRIRELSLVAVPADEGATFQVSSSANNFAMALKEAYDLTHSPGKNHTYKTERGSDNKAMDKEITKPAVSEKSEVAELKKKLEALEKSNAEYVAKERKALEEKYTSLCAEKGVTAVDFKALESSMLEVLIAQVSGVVVKESEEAEAPVEEPAKADEPKAEEADDEDEDEDVAEESYKGYKITSGNGSLRGSALSIEKFSYK